MPKTVGAALKAHLEGEKLTVAVCWKITRTDGIVLGFTEHDADITIDADGLGTVTYEAATGFRKSASQATAELRVDDQDIEGILSAASIDAADVRAGKFSAAEIKTFLVNYTDLGQGILMLRRGTIGRIALRDYGFKAELVGLTKQLMCEVVEPYTIDCLVKDLGDARCKVDLGPFTSTGTVSSVTSDTEFSATGLGSSEDDFYAFGNLTWLTGDNAGQKMAVLENSGSSIRLYFNLGNAITVGDTFSIVAGCDRTKETCIEKFDNIINFRGHGVFTPGTDILFDYPDAHLNV